ncbi:MAG TPA: hypothetical protein VIT91_04160 [Chthoniobacterales bacterium]
MTESRLIDAILAVLDLRIAVILFRQRYPLARLRIDRLLEQERNIRIPDLDSHPSATRNRRTTLADTLLDIDPVI